MKTIKAKVHMLPTEWGYGVIYSNGSVITIHEPRLHKSEWTPQNLYITTDEKIKEGDWFINTGSGGHPTPKVYQANSENSKAFKEFGPYPEIRKIIATTDPKLNEVNDKNKVDESWFRPFIPKIPHSFIEECYASGGIDEVFVEYEEFSLNGGGRPNAVVLEPKLNPNNTIIIHPVEEKMYSREEVINAFKYAFKEAKEAVIWSSDYPIYVANKWIEENL